MKQSKRLLSLLLSLSIMLSFALVPAYADDAAAYTEAGSASYVNPLYPDAAAPALPEEQAELADADDTSTTLEAPRTQASYLSIQDAAGKMRDYMRDRVGSFTLYVYAPGYEGDVISLVEGKLLPMAYSEELSTGITTGDYLKWSWGNISYNWPSSYSSYLTIYCYMTYYTTASQESWLINTVQSTVDSLNLWKVSDYQKYLGIYQYVTNHVDYDYAGLSTFDDNYTYGGVTYDPYGNDDYGIFTAYAAMYKGTAVCQGYATLFYAMCRAMGLPVRVITSIDHAWNIAKIGSYWYNLDSTWDGGSSASYLDYFLKGSSNFASDHPSEYEYLIPAFTSQYPISYYDYSPVASDYQPVSQFRDVPADSYYYKDIQDMVDRGLFNGYNKYTFQPNGTMTRAMLVTVLWRLAGCPSTSTDMPFVDIPQGKYYTTAVAWAYKNGITSGVSDTSFNPNGQLNRQQLSAFLYRYANTYGYSTSAYNDLSAYTDTDTIANYAVDAIHWSVGAGIVNGYANGTIRPTNSATRGQMAAMLARFIRYYGL